MTDTIKQLPLDFGDKPPVVEEIITDDHIPRPVGYHLLVAMPEVSDTYGDSGLIKSGKTVHQETILSMVGVVLDMGDQAYADKERYPTGPWCKVGDYVVFRANSGTRFKVGSQEMRLMNDDNIEAVVQNINSIRAV